MSNGVLGLWFYHDCVELKTLFCSHFNFIEEFYLVLELNKEN